VSFGLHWYPEYLHAVTGYRREWDDLYKIGDRIYSLIRAYWKREIPQFSRRWDYPPDRWFEESPSQGKVKGLKVDREKYEQMLSYYYELRGWDENGIPLQKTLDDLGLKGVSKEMMG
jgi:aldehyde:ferredoxin oxidoreductase